MKTLKKHLYIITAALVFTSTACEKDFLDKENKKDLSGSSFWKTKEHAEQGLLSTYAALRSAGGDKWTWFEELYISSTYKSDEIINNKAEGYGKALHSYTYTTDESTFTNLWHSCFAGISRANQCIENIPNVSGNAQNGLSDEQKKMMITEAKFLRGYYYFTLINYFKNIPLITKVQKEEIDFYPSEAKEEDIWNQIESDFKEGVQFLPETRAGNEVGRVTKYTAQAYLGKAYLFQEKFEDANTEFAGVINSGKYDLMASYGDNFNGAFENNKESLFEIQFSADRTNSFDARNPIAWEVSSYALNGWELFYPSPYLESEFKKDKTTAGNYSDRVYATLFFDDPESKAPVVNEPGVEMKYSDVKDGLNYHVFFKKYAYPADLADNKNYTGVNIHLMRYADVLLMHAEALNERGLTAEALTYVNKVRERAKAAPLAAMGAAPLREQIRHHERPCELSMEFGIRWADLYRWARSKSAPEPIKTVLTNHNHEFANNFINGKHDIYPVPFSEISKNPNIHQAQNW